MESLDRRELLSTALGTAAGTRTLVYPEAAQHAAASAKQLNLKITGLKTFLVNVGSVNWIFCQIYTNQGLVGLGEASMIPSKEATVAQAIMEHERFLVGKDPTNIELLWQGMFRHPRWRGGPILNSAISAVDIALWDILGQALGAPIYKLLGGAARERIRLYVDIDPTAEAYLKVKEMGYTAAKSTAVEPDHLLIEPNKVVRESARRLAEIRQAVGDDFDIAVDAHGRLTTTMAIDFCTRVEELDLFWVEEATQLEDLGELELLRSKTKTHLATGERSYTKWGFADYCSRHLVDYIQPDVCHCGGISELKKISVLAETYRVNVAPHNPNSLVSTLASVHVDACSAANTIQESTPGNYGELRPAPWMDDLFHGKGPEVKNGYMELPTLPGLGVSLNEKVAAEHTYKPINREHFTFADGSVADQ